MSSTGPGRGRPARLRARDRQLRQARAEAYHEAYDAAWWKGHAAGVADSERAHAEELDTALENFLTGLTRQPPDDDART